ncbi:MAG: bifunctional GTP diphosphokinase/guanosine-3',5'-bis(diphosphate) 3'-diphosphatase [Oceanospirillales bacterium LUC14_002_19_P2]|nr:MAG: bifunctional GTP diphosphokinase/guanosine-3',5'-bis(diphosphate) 3'-diphosphatase [Oceanospirillales bacterium LUC14_002_19_P2]
MPTIDSLAHRLKAYLNTDQINLVKRAYYYAEQAHDGQKRRSGEPYVTHPLEVAGILADMHMDHQSLMAAMLHDVIEDTGIRKDDIRDQFGDVVAEIVDGVSKLTHMQFEDKTLAQAENFQKMALAMARDIRVILVKLADRLHNMRTLGVLRPEKRRRIAKETLDIYAPISQRLGMHQMRIEFEDLGFAAMHPMRSNMLTHAVRNARGNRSEIVTKVVDSITNRLEKQGLNGRVMGREKHLYSIYKKMKVQRKSFSEIMDVFGIRIIVDSIDSCYRCLGLVHNLFKPIPGRFKDYIAIPKANGYQSLHTTLFGLHGIPVEVQIRTQEMEDMANNGIAAHWLYKSGDEALLGSRDRTRVWLQNLLELQQKAGDSLEFIENVKVDLFPDDTYVFSPQGDILELPRGATPVDFAYAVHTDIGSSCVACRIDRKLASLSQPLDSGQTVEIITAPGARPNAAWLNFVTTSKARSNIRHYLKNQKRTESIALGRRLLSKVLTPMGIRLEELEKADISRTLAHTGFDKLDDLLEDIGLGNRMAYLVARHLADTHESMAHQMDLSNPEKPLTIRGTEGMVISFAKCCHPIPGDPVVGHVSSGRGLVIHTESCRNITEIRHNPEKVLEVDWDKNVHGEFYVDLEVAFEQLQGMIASLATTVTAAEASIEKISVEEKDARLSQAQLLIKVKDRVHLALVIKRLRTIRGVTSISRRREA